jgi:hypothetical protein
MAKRAQTVKPSETMQVPSEQQFKALMRAVKNADADINDAQSTKSELVKKAVDKQHLDRDAFSIFQKLNRKSDKKLATTLAHLLHYVEVGGLNERIERQGELIGREKELAETDVKEVVANGGRKKRGPNKKKNVVPFEARSARDQAEFDPGVDGEAVH